MKLILAIILLTSSLAHSQEGHQLIVRIEGIKDVTGHMQIGLYNNDESFPKVDEEFERFYIPVDSISVIYKIENLLEGYYAIAIYHDKNSNKKIDKNFIGIPKERYGFSNNVRPRFSAPSFEKTKIFIDRDTNTSIKLIK